MVESGEIESHMKYDKMKKITHTGTREKVHIYLSLIIELILVFSCILPFFKPLNQHEYNGSNFIAPKAEYTESFTDKNIDGYYVDETMIAEGDSLFDYRIEIPGTNLKRGSYEVRISYSTNTNTNTYRTGSWSEYYQTEIGRQYVTLDPEKNECVFSMESDLDVDGYTVGVNFGGEGYIFVDNISITETSSAKIRNLVTVVFTIFIINCLWITYKRKSEAFNKNNITVWLILGSSVIFASLPVFTPYLFGGHDLAFHLNRIEGIKNALLAGDIPVRMHFSALEGAGYPTSVFYGDLLLYLPAVLRVLGWSVQSAYQMYILFINILTCVIVYKVFSNIFKNQWIALFGSCMYMLVPYRLECIYVRAAVGEYTAACFYPLIIYGLYLMYSEEEEKKHDWIWFALGFSGIILSHIISTFVAFCVTLLFCIIKIKDTFSKEIFVKLCKAVIVTLGICAAFLIPFVDYMSLPVAVNVIARRGEFEARTATLSQLLSVFPYGSQNLALQFQAEVGSEGPEMTLALGGVLVLVPIIYGIYCLQTEYKRSRREKLGEITLLLGGVCLFMTTSYFPWNAVEELGEKVRYLMYSIQYPWRLLSAVSILWVIALTVVINSMREHVKEAVYYCTVTALCVLSFVSASFLLTSYMGNANKSYIVHERDVSSNSIGNGEYILDGAPWGYDGILYEEEKLHISMAKRDKDVYLVECNNITDEVQYVQIPVINYDNYSARDIASGNVLKIDNGEQCRIKVEVPENYSGSIAIEYVVPWYWRLSEVISLCTIIGICYVVLRKKKSC